MSSANHEMNLNKFIRHELQIYILYTIFLTLLFSAFLSYERILLGKVSTHYLPYGYCFIRALIMAKLIMIGEALKLGERFPKAPLIIPVLYKTIVFCIFLLVFHIIEQLTIGYIKGESTLEIYLNFTNHLDIFLAQLSIMFFTYILFFSVLGISSVLGKNVLWDIFFHSRRE